MSLVLFGLMPVAFAGQADDNSRTFFVGFSSAVFADNDLRDIKIAMDLWAREISRTMEMKKYEITISNNLKELRTMICRDKYHLVTLSALEYLKVKDSASIVPTLVGANYTGKSREYLLLVRHGSGIRTVKDLAAKIITLPPGNSKLLSDLWLDVLFLRAGIRDRDGYFRQVKESKAPSQAIMAVFFGQADATVVNREAFEIANTLNPQLGLKLTPIAESKSLLGDITCFLPTVSKREKDKVVDTALSLHKSAAGKQVLTLFKINRIINFQPSFLEGLTELLQERDRLLADKTKRKEHALR